MEKDSIYMKVGIITMFHNNTNYGGILQSYALVKSLERFGVTAEQISYNNLSAYSFLRRFKANVMKCLPLLKFPAKIPLFLKICKRSRMVVNSAKELVPHSKKIYTEKNIVQTASLYDIFITGSDQVWYGNWPAYFLPFVPKGKNKIAYAASTGKTNLSSNDIDLIKSYTADYTAISVRENNTIIELQDVLKDKTIKLVLDPTLLLERNDWEIIASSRRIKEPYVFCYFLGSDKKIRDFVFLYAKKNKEC